jgi:aryl-alcohol dehydrogenase-like predicted oxidoreductase
MRVGLGGGALGSLTRDAAFRLLDAARELGIELVDVARSYGAAEEHLGAWQRAHGSPFKVVTKGGYGVDGVGDWTGNAVLRSLEEARQKLGRVDVFLLHSCNTRALDDVRDACSRVDDVELGYSGDNDDLHAALDRAQAMRFKVIQQSLSLLDGRARVHTLPRARSAGMFVIAKRVLANAPWRENASGDDYRRQRERFLRAALPDVGIPFDELFLRYAAFTPGVNVILVGTARVEALERAVECVEKGALDDSVHHALAPALARCDDPSPV